MKKTLVKMVVMRLLFSIILSFTVVAYGQDVSQGTSFLPNKTVTSIAESSCTVSDSMHTFHNLRANDCPIFPTFKNGESRFLQAGDGIFYSESNLFNAVGFTSCAAAGNATWVRNFQNTEDQLKDFILWELTWIPRKADNSLDTANSKFFSFIGCPIYKSVAGGGGGDEPPAGGDTPIVIDLNNDGIVRLTNKSDGVLFDLNNNKQKEQRPWLADDNDGWLVFDAFGDGRIENGSWLFSNYSAQNEVPGKQRNGYIALSGWDDDKNGIIDARDGVWTSLAIWKDSNHDGVSNTGELIPMPYSGIEFLSLDYKESRRKDKHGNEFRYRAKMKFIDGREGYSFDVILADK